MEQVKIRLDVVEREISDLKKVNHDISNKLAVIETRTSVNENDILYIKDKLGKIETNTTWLLRIVIGAIVIALLNFVIKGGSVI